MAAKFAMAGVVNAGERGDPGRFRVLQLLPMHRAFELGQRRQHVAVVTQPRLSQIDEVETRDCAQDCLGWTR